MWICSSHTFTAAVCVAAGKTRAARISPPDKSNNAKVRKHSLHESCPPSELIGSDSGVPGPMNACPSVVKERSQAFLSQGDWRNKTNERSAGSERKCANQSGRFFVPAVDKSSCRRISSVTTNSRLCTLRREEGLQSGSPNPVSRNPPVPDLAGGDRWPQQQPARLPCRIGFFPSTFFAV